MSRSFVVALALSTLPTLFASPLASRVRRQVITTLSTAQIDVFTPFTFFASTAYCDPSTTINWSCGANCEANPGFIPTASGGDGSDVQFWYVGFDPSLNTVIVAHQGTDPSELVADLTDADIEMTTLNSSLFPGVSSSVEVHKGFADEQSEHPFRRANHPLNHGTSSVTIVGHSLGAALSLLDSAFLPLHLPVSTTFQTVLYGLPRVGNQDWANFVDANAQIHLTHINNKEDPIPILPGMFLGFHHPSGEVHIQDSLAWDACPGQDNPSTLCIVGDVPNIFESDESDHDGPYNGVTMGC